MNITLYNFYIKTTQRRQNQSVCNTHVRRNATKQKQSCMQYTYLDKYNQTKPVETMKNMSFLYFYLSFMFILTLYIFVEATYQHYKIYLPKITDADNSLSFHGRTWNFNKIVIWFSYTSSNKWDIIYINGKRKNVTGTKVTG